MAALFATALMIAVLLAWRAVRVRWLPSCDWALIELRVRDVGGRHTPLTGPFSRYGWNHPGPLGFYVLAIPYRIAASRSSTLLLGAVLVNAVSVAVAVLVFLRTGGRALALFALLVLALLCRALGGSFLMDPWNPYMTVLLFMMFVALSYALACGRRWALPAVIAAGTFLVQEHVGYAVVVLALLLVGGAWFWTARRETGGPPLRGVVVASIVLAIALWVPPIVQQAVASGGNLKELVDYATAGHANAGIGTGLRVVAQQLSPRPPWVTGDETALTFTHALSLPKTPPIAVGLVALLLGSVLAWRRRDFAALRLCSLAVACAGAAVVSAAQVTGPVLPYLVRWVWSVGALCWLAAGWAVWRAFATRVPDTARRLAVSATALATLALFVAVLAEGWNPTLPTAQASDAVRALAPSAIDAARGPGDSKASVYVEGPGLLGAWVAWGVELQFERAGHTTFGPRSALSADQLGEQRARGPKAAAMNFVVAVNDDIARDRARPGYTFVAEYDSIAGAKPLVRKRQRLIAEINELHRRGYGDQSPEVLRLFARVAALKAPATSRVHVALFARSPMPQA